MYRTKFAYDWHIVDKYPSIISYHGKYFYRSGSTMRTITGKELDTAILKSQGRTWDSRPIIKIGYFVNSDADLKYQDEVHGSLIEQVDKTIEKGGTKSERHVQSMMRHCRNMI